LTVPLSLYGRAVTDYVIQYKVTGASSWSTFTDGVGASTAATVTGLTPVTSYQFQVSAVTSAGSSEYSAPVTTTTLAAGPSGITSAPLSLKVGKKTATSRALSWKAPVTLNGGSITDYIIQYRVGGTTEWSTFTDSVSVSKAGKVTGLTKKLKYQFQVAAVTSAGTSPYSVATKAS
jgi:chitodextrinase